MKVFFVSLGCDKNKVDSEKILKFFMKSNITVDIVDSPYDADVAILNTCSFIRDAKNESILWIKELVKLKKQGILKKIMVIGCLATEITKYTDNDNKKLFDNIDVVLPLDKYIECLNELNDRVLDILSFSSFIKICDGCDKYCTYCIIPYLRGRFKSNSIENIVKEVKILAKNGVKELSIVGQDILSYGKDIYGKKSIKKLVDEISKINGIEWIRLLYCYPEEIDDDVISLIRDNKKVLPYIDMPIQHASDKILKLMNRKTTNESIKKIINKLRSEVPNIIIRTTLMVGFPGETDKDFEVLTKFVKEMKFDKLGVFSYSREKLSKSYDMQDQIDDAVKEERKKKILDIQKDIVLKNNKSYVGKVFYSIVEGYDSNKNLYVVRPYFDARDIDDKVYVDTNEMLISGEFVNVEIIKTKGMDLMGKIV